MSDSWPSTLRPSPTTKMPSATELAVHSLPASDIASDPLNLSAKLPKLTPRKRRAPLSNPEPFPETPGLAPPPGKGSLRYSTPVRRILSPKDHELFQQSTTHTLVVSFVFSLADSVIDTSISAVSGQGVHPVVQRVLDILSEVEGVVRASPPEDQEGSRFGNKGFREFLDGVGAQQKSWHQELDIEEDAAIEELSTYFLQSFGNRTRIDYGSGHELNFMIWL
jgi:serine/threonine-protein phosphatase 2A activator